MTFPSSPGVYTKESDISNYVAVSGTSGGAFVGSFTWGPVMQSKVVSDEASLIRQYGKPDETNYIDWYCANDFLAYANDLNVVRVVDTATAKNATTEPVAEGDSGVLIKNDTHFQEISTAGTAKRGVFAARYPGVLGNSLKVSMADGTCFGSWEYRKLFAKYPTTSAHALSLGAKSDELHIVVVDQEGRFSGTPGTVLEKYAFLSKALDAKNANGALNYYGNVINRSSKYIRYLGPISNIPSNKYVASITKVAEGEGYFQDSVIVNFGKPSGEFGVRATGHAVVTGGKITEIIIDEPGSGYKNAPSIYITDPKRTSTGPVAQYRAVLSTETVSATAYGKVVGAVTVTNGGTGYSRPIVKFSAPPAGGVQALGSATVVAGVITSIGITRKGSGYPTTPAATITIDDPNGTGATFTVRMSNANDDLWGNPCVNGSNGEPRWFRNLSQPYSEKFEGGSDGSLTTGLADELIEGWNLFNNPDEVKVSLLISGDAGGSSNHTVVCQHLLDNIADVRKDCVVFISPKYGDVVGKSQSDAVEAIIKTKDLINRPSSYGFFDSGWKLRYDKFFNRYVWLPLNPDIAGLVARTEQTNDAWWSPAGHNRGLIKNGLRLAFSPNLTSRDDLYLENINPVVSFSGQGMMLYGDKTMVDRPGVLSYINVRRLFIIIEKAIADYAKYNLFEFNDPFTRSRFVNTVEPFLSTIRSRNGLYDYKVVCDESNNTPESIDRGEFVANIYIRPIRSINFITLNFIASKTGMSFTEDVTTDNGE